MELNFNQLSSLKDIFTELKDQKLPFKLSLIIAKNIGLIDKEIEFYIAQEREFAIKYLEQNEDGSFVQEGESAFKIKEGLEQECRDARKELDKFTCEVNLRMIPLSLLEGMEFTPAQLVALGPIVEEEEE